MTHATKFEPPGRLTSIDAYRGFVMLLMASEGLRIAEVAHSFPQSPVWQFLAYQAARQVIAVTCTSRIELFGMADAAEEGELRFRNPAHPAAKAAALGPAILSSV